MPQKTTALMLLLVSLAACKGDAPPEAEEPRATLPQVLPNLPVPPEGELLSTGGTGSALQMVFSSPVPGDSVVEHYRRVLAQPPYQLVNEAVSGEMTSFFVEQAGPSMWVAVQRLSGGGALVTIAGAKPRELGADSVRVLETRRPEPGEIPLN